jgi:hypothetical protein
MNLLGMPFISANMVGGSLGNMKRIIKLSMAIVAPVVFMALMSFATPARAGCPETCTKRHDSCLKRCAGVAGAQSPQCTKACDEKLDKCNARCTPAPQSTSLFKDQTLGQADTDRVLEILADQSPCTNLTQ